MDFLTTLKLTPEQIQNLLTTLERSGLQICGAVVIVLVGWFMASWLTKKVERGLNRVNRLDKTLAHFFASLMKYAILAVTGIAALNQFGVQTASLIAVLGAASLAIALAMQSSLSHVASGVMLLIFRPFKVGDYVEVAGQGGTVSAIGLFMTELNTPDNVRIILPNGQVWNTAVKNYSRNSTRRIEIVLGISYEDNIDKAIKTASAVLAKEPRLLADPASTIAVKELADSSVNLVIRGWCNRADFWDTKCDLTKDLKNAMDKAKISIPYPQRTVHMVKSA